MGLPYYRFFPADYLRDTRRLTLLQHGAYRLLIDEYMGAGGLRGDLDGMCRVCGALSGEERAAVEFVLSEYFMREGPGWRHTRCDEELEHLASKTFSARDAALTRWKSERKPKAMRTHSERNADAMPVQSQSPDAVAFVGTVGVKGTDGASVGKGAGKPVASRATRLPPDWRLPEDWKNWACDVHHLEPQRVVRISLAFRDYWIAKPKDATKLDWKATWRNWIRKECQDA